MVISRYIGGREVTAVELANITITNNHEISTAINRAVARINSEAQFQIVSTTHSQARKDVVKNAKV